MSECPACHAVNDPGHRFCSGCGSPLAARACRGCGAALAPGARFCTSCGATATVEPQQAGAIVDGAWHRAPGELARRVPTDAMRQAFKSMGIDIEGLVRGTLLGRALDVVLARTVLVPLGSVGVVLKDGVCVRILPPGEQTSAGILKDLDQIVFPGRSGLFLVDVRPVPVTFPLEVAGRGLDTVQVQLLARAPREAGPLATFLAEVLGDRDSVGAEELHGRLRADVEQVVTDLIRAGRPLPTVEREARAALEPRLARLGLRGELSVATRHTTHRLAITLGGAPLPTAPCACGATIALGQRFCVTCGTPAATVAQGDALLTADVQSIELDLVLLTRGDGAVVTPLDVLTQAARRYLRDVRSDALDLAALGDALTAAATDALHARAHTLVSLDVVDSRTTGGAWALGARAAMARATEEAKVGREWLTVATEARALEEATLAAALDAARVQRDHAWSERGARLEDSRRTAELEAGEREVARTRADAEHTDATDADRRRYARERDAQAHRITLESERRRRAVDDDVYGDRARREARMDELRAMSALDADIAEREQRHKLETLARLDGKSEAQILAMQAAELAGAEHGAAFAEALGKLADGEAARRERERADARIDAKDDRMTRLMEQMIGAASARDAESRAAWKGTAETTTRMAETAVVSHARVAAARAGCPHCAAVLPAGARFCGACGNTTG